MVLRHDDTVLVVKNLLGNGKWHLPGGGCHRYESFEQGAARELCEEVGVIVDKADLYQLLPAPLRSKRQFDYQLFLLPVHAPVELRLDRREILESRWIRISELNKSNAGESTLQAVACLRE